MTIKQSIAGIFIPLFLAGCLYDSVTETKSFTDAQYDEEMAYQKELLAKYKADTEKAEQETAEGKAPDPEELLQRITWRMNLANGPLCSKFAIYDSGLILKLEKQKKQTWTVTELAPNYPAQRVGLQVGDEIISIDSATATQYPNPWDALMDASDKLTQFGSDYKLNVIYKRNGQKKRVKMGLARSCNYYTKLQADNMDFNAFSDGTQKLEFYHGLLKAYNYDEDYVAYVWGHEMAHAEMEHVEKGKGNAGVALLGNAIARIGLAYLDHEHGTNLSGSGGDFLLNLGTASIMSRHSREFETEADYMGIYYMARAKYNIDKGAEAARIMSIVGNDTVSSDNFLSSHPDSVKRFLRLDQVVQDIKASGKTGQDVIPTYANGTPFTVYK